MNKSVLSLMIGSAAIAGVFGYLQLQRITAQHTPPPKSAPHAVFDAALSKQQKLTMAQLQERIFRYDTVSGNYLVGRFAQRNHDWETANKHIDTVIEKVGAAPNLLKRSMVLAMGAGAYEQALAHAHSLSEGEEDPGALAYLFLAAESFKNKDYQTAADYVGKMPEGSLSQFILPLLESWSNAALGTHDTRSLNQNTVHIYHAILIADFMGEHSHVETLLERSLNAVNITVEDIERIADLYAHIQKPDKALALYDKILALDPGDTQVAQKAETLKAQENEALFDRIEVPEHGVAEALYDMARILARDYSDESARVFGSMARYLNPNDTDITLLLAKLSARNARFEDAIALYQSIGDGDKNFLEAKRNAADLFEEQGYTQNALNELHALYDAHGDIDAKIQIGDIYRRNDQFKEAIESYNTASNTFENGIPADYWHLYYLRGMAYEQDKNWEKAEEDLKAALAYQPENPYVLNYLGYAWADQGLNLEEALQMIRKAVDLRPQDGFITDSLGWVLYRMNRFEEAVPHLERAVELEPYDPVINDHLGDAYWQVGRRLEARFQWARAKNHAEEAALIAAIDQKLDHGLEFIAQTPNPAVQEAKSGHTDSNI